MPQLEFFQFADIMQDGAGEQQFTIDSGIMFRGHVADPQQGNDMLKEAAKPCVMKALGGGSLAERLGDRLVIQKRA